MARLYPRMSVNTRAPTFTSRINKWLSLDARFPELNEDDLCSHMWYEQQAAQDQINNNLDNNFTARYAAFNKTSLPEQAQYHFSGDRLMTKVIPYRAQTQRHVTGLQSSPVIYESLVFGNFARDSYVPQEPFSTVPYGWVDDVNNGYYSHNGSAVGTEHR